MIYIVSFSFLALLSLKLVFYIIHSALRFSALIR